MRTIHHAAIAAPVDTVFALARDVEAWPRLLSSYRWCRVLERTPERLVFAMGGWVRGWPARWTAEQKTRPQEHRIRFLHLRGITRGMRVEWRFTAARGITQVELEHDLVLDWPLVGRLVSDLIVGPIFIDYIARRTLQAVKTHAEATAAVSAPEGARS